MAKKESRTVSTLSEFLEWVAQFNDEQYLFRGVKNETYEMAASASRRLPPEYKNNPSRLLKINKQLIEDARARGHDQKDGQTLSDLELLTELQHFRAATCLIDFTRSALVALWFACESGTNEENDANGKVFAVSRGVRLRTVKSDLIKKDLDWFFEPDEKNQSQLFQWEPKLQNSRIIAQHSVFVFGGAKVEIDAECKILAGSKSSILKSLNEVSDISEASMYPDFDGFARLHAHDKPHDEPNAQTYLQRGLEAHQRNDLDTAIEYYNQVISLEPETSILVQAYYNRGLAYNSKREFDLAIENFNQAMTLKLDGAGVYFNRAYAYGEKGNHDQAIRDYTEAVLQQPDIMFAYYNRGIAHRAKGNYDLAIMDFTEEIRRQPGYGPAYLNLGLSFYSKGDFEKAISNFSRAIELQSDNSNAYVCRGDAYSKLGLVDKASLDYTMVIGLNPDSPLGYYKRSEARLRLAQWDDAKSDLTIAKEKGIDVVALFRSDYESIADFEERYGVAPRGDIAAMLTPP